MRYRSAILILVILSLSSCAAIPALRVEMNDAAVVQGGAAIFRFDGGREGVEASASFSGGDAFVVTSGEAGLGIVAVDLEAAPRIHELTLRRGEETVTEKVEVKDGGYGVERLTLPPGMVELSAEALERVRQESALIAKVWEGTTAEPLFSGPFMMPLDGRVSGRFGKGRVLNGSPRSPHSGIDIAAPEGTGVSAVNSGRVVFTGDFFFKGRFVVIDHGLGVFSEYCHLSSVEVEEGRLVERGERIGGVGATGRATGPHLHFAVKVGASRVSPELLFEAASRFIGLVQGGALSAGAGAEEGRRALQ